MLNENESIMLVNQLSNNAAIMQDYALATLVQEQEYSLMAQLKPKIYKDGNSWRVLYGDNLQDGICGFGETPYKAVLEFNKAWSNK